MRSPLTPRSFLALTVALFLSCASITYGEETTEKGPLAGVKRAHASTVEVIGIRSLGRLSEESNGAGVVLTADGYIATAYHVIREFSQIKARPVDGLWKSASVERIDDDYDLAIIKIEPDEPLTPIRVASTRLLTPGRKTFLIGNPGGAGSTVSTGQLGNWRNVRWENCQARLPSVEASISTGNSGGGTFDLETGELLGITVAKSTSRENQGYLVPASRLSALIHRPDPTHMVDTPQSTLVEPAQAVGKAKRTPGMP